MAFKQSNRTAETSTTTGTGDMSLLGALASDFNAFASKYSNGDTFTYEISQPGTAYETGTGTYNSGPNTVSRTTVKDGTNGTSAVNFGAGTKIVCVSITAEGSVSPSNLIAIADNATLDASGEGGTLEIKAGGVGTTQIEAGAVTNAKRANIAAHSYSGNNTGSATAPADISAANLKADLSIAYADVSGLGTAAQNADTAYVRVDGTHAMAAALSMGNFAIQNQANAVNQQDSATLADVQNYAAQLETTAVQVATTGVLPAGTYLNGASGIGATFTQTSAAALIIDGYTVLLNDRIIVQNQASGLQNGIYTCTTLGTGLVPFVLTRAFDMDQPSEFAGALITVLNGTVNGPTGTGTSNVFLCTTSNPTIGTTAIAFSPVNTVTQNGAQTLTNKRLTRRVVVITPSATPAINSDNGDVFTLAAGTTNITSFTSGLTGTPNSFDRIIVSITTTGTITIAWGASFESSSISLITQINGATTVDIAFRWNAVTSKWRMTGWI
jgi:hypothetical protein